MLNRAITQGKNWPAGRTAIVLSRRNAALIVLLAYAVVAIVVTIFIPMIVAIQGYDDARDEQVVTMVVAMTLLLSVKALIGVRR